MFNVRVRMVMTDLANTFYNPGHCEQLPLC